MTHMVSIGRIGQIEHVQTAQCSTDVYIDKNRGREDSLFGCCDGLS
jgi:hypothetical protein